MTPTAKSHLDNVYRSLNKLHKIVDLKSENSRLLDVINHLENNLQLLEEEISE